MLLSSLRLHGPQLEEYSKSTLDQGTLHSFYISISMSSGHRDLIQTFVYQKSIFFSLR